jgi:hypothetical protein
MVASVYAYYSHMYARFSSVDFEQWVLYTGEGEIFRPDQAHYVLLFYSSLQEPIDSTLQRLDNPENLPVIALDLSQSRTFTHDGIIYTTAGINTLLGYLNRFGIERVPTAIVLEHQEGARYKQGSLRLEL